MDEITSLFEQFRVTENTMAPAAQSPPFEQGERMHKMTGICTSRYRCAQRQHTDSITENQPSLPLQQEQDDPEPEAPGKYCWNQLCCKTLTDHHREPRRRSLSQRAPRYGRHPYSAVSRSVPRPP